MTDNNLPVPAVLSPDQVDGASFWPNIDPDQPPSITTMLPPPETLHLTGKLAGSDRKPLYLDVPRALLKVHTGAAGETIGASIECFPEDSGQIMQASGDHPELAILQELARVLASDEVDDAISGSNILDNLIDNLGLTLETWTESNILTALKAVL